MLTRPKHWWFTGQLLIAGLLVVAMACGSSDDGNGNGNGDATAVSEDLVCGSAASEVEAAPFDGTILTFDDILAKDADVTNTDVVNWGLMFEQSGPLAGFGEPAGDGVKLAVQEINDAGGFQVGDTIYTINLIERDTNSNVSQTLAIATEFVRDENLCVIFGPATIGDAEVTQITQPRGALNICPCPEREITSLKDVETMQDGAFWSFQTLSAPSRFLPPGAQNTREEYPEYETFATVCANSQIGKAFCGFFKDAYEAAGFEHVAEELVPENTIDYNPILTSLGDPDIILNFLDAGTAQFDFLRQSWQQDVGKFYIAVELPLDIFEALVGEGIRDKIVSAGAAPRGHAQYTSDVAEDFFENKYKPFVDGPLGPAAFVAMTMYDPVYMLIAAMQAAGTVEDTTAISAALEQVHLAGVGEDDIFFDERHVIVTGNDTCIIYQGEMDCRHVPPVR